MGKFTICYENNKNKSITPMCNITTASACSRPTYVANVIRM